MDLFYNFQKINLLVGFFAVQIDKDANNIIHFIRTVSKVQILITFQALSLKVFNIREIKVVNMMNDELFKNFTISCNHAIGTTQSYELSLRKYCNYFDMSLKELLEEAEEDEMNGVKWKHSRLKSKLVEYRHYMFQNYAAGTVRKEMNCIIFFYKFYDIEVLDLPKVNDKNIQKPAPIYFKDLPDKEVIRKPFRLHLP